MLDIINDSNGVCHHVRYGGTHDFFTKCMEDLVKTICIKFAERIEEASEERQHIELQMNEVIEDLQEEKTKTINEAFLFGDAVGSVYSLLGQNMQTLLKVMKDVLKDDGRMLRIISKVQSLKLSLQMSD